MTPGVKCEISIVVPVLNEAANIRDLVRRLTKVLGRCSSTYEIIFVAGGSDDGTEEAILKEREQDQRVKLVWLSRNFGHQEAVSAGMEFASGEAIITMDGDLEHPPEVIPKLLEKWREGYEVITTARTASPGSTTTKRLLSRWFYRLLNRLSGLHLAEGSADFRLMDRVAVRALCDLPERSRFLRGLVEWIGFNQTRVAYEAESRHSGVSKYDLKTMIKLAARATLAFSSTPLYLMAAAGLCIALISFLFGIYAVAATLVSNVRVPGWASILAAFTFMGGVQLMSVGMVGVYVARIYDETKNRPVYIVRQLHGLPGAPLDGMGGSNLPRETVDPST